MRESFVSSVDDLQFYNELNCLCAQRVFGAFSLFYLQLQNYKADQTKENVEKFAYIVCKTCVKLS